MHLKRINFAYVYLALAGGIIFCPPIAMAGSLTSNECSITTGATDQPCPSTVAAPNQPAPFIGAKSDPGNAAGPIDVWSACRYVNNISGNTSVFVPFNSSMEWEAFIANAPTNIISSTHCSRPTTMSITPDSSPSDVLYCNSPSPATQTVSLPYYQATGTDLHTGVELPAIPSFTCVVKGLCDPLNPGHCGADQTWSEYATATFEPTASPDVANAPSGWVLMGVSYSGTPPAPNPPQDVGQCGTADGQALTSAPTSNLCASGTASTIFGTGPWTWSCLGSGAIASCSASLQAPNGQCGTANGVATLSAPTGNLCSAGVASTVTGSGPWAWTCAGTSTTASCSVPSESGMSCGTVYTADRTLDRIQWFDGSGNYLGQFGPSGAAQGQFTLVWNLVFAPDGNILTFEGSTTGNVGTERVQEFSSNWNPLLSFGSPGTNNGQFQNPEMAAVDANGAIWVPDALNNRIQKFDAEGNWLLSIGGGGNTNNPGDACTLSPGGTCPSGTGNSLFNYPTGIVMDQGGFIWTISNNGLIQKFDTSGNFISSFATVGYTNVWGLAVDSSGNLWFGNLGNNTLEEYNQSGTLLRQVPTTGNPVDIAIDTCNNVWVSENNIATVEKYDPNGNLLLQFGGSWGAGPGQFEDLLGIAIKP